MVGFDRVSEDGAFVSCAELAKDRKGLLSGIAANKLQSTIQFHHKGDRMGYGTYMVKESDADERDGKPAYNWEIGELEEPRGVVDEGRDGAHGVDTVEADECAEGEVGQIVGMGRVEFGIVVNGWGAGEG